MYTIIHLYHHIYHTMTLNVHRFSICTVIFITEWPLAYNILHLHHHIYKTMTLNVQQFSIYTIIFIT